MSNRSRRLVFLALLVAFFIVGVPLALYSYGYRLDIRSYSVSESGGIFIRSIPADAEIEIDGKEIKNESGILNTGTFVKGLIPKKYAISVSKEGYQPIEIVAEVTPFEATSFDKLLLIPDIDQLLIAGKFIDLIAGEEFIATEDEVGRIKFENQVIPGQKAIAFTADRKSILTESEKPGVYLLVNLAKPKSSLNINETFWSLKSSKLKLPGETPIRVIIPHPYEPNKFIISTRSALYLLDVKQLSISMIGDGVEKIASSGNSAALIRGGEASLYNFTMKSVSPLISVAGAKQTAFSEGGSKLAILWQTNVLEIYDIRKKTSLRFSIKSMAPSGKMEWHKDEDHIFLSGAAGIYFLETDNEVFKPELIVSGSDKFDYGKDGLYFLSTDGIRQLKL